MPYHNFGRYKVISLTCQPLHLSFLLPVYSVIKASFIKGATGGLQVSTYMREYKDSVEEKDLRLWGVFWDVGSWVGGEKGDTEREEKVSEERMDGCVQET